MKKMKKSNLQKGRDIVARFIYVARSDMQLSNDIENLSYQDFNIKYNMNISSEINFQKSIYRLYNTYFKRAKRNSTDEYYKLLIRTALARRKQKRFLKKNRIQPKYPHNYKHAFIDSHGQKNMNVTTINMRRNAKNITVFSNESNFYMSDADVAEMIYLRNYFLYYIANDPVVFKNLRYFFIIYTTKSSAAISSSFMFIKYSDFLKDFNKQYDDALMKICQSDEFVGAFIEFSCF